MKKENIFKVLVLILVLGTIVVNSLANILPINNVTTGEISDAIPIFFVPAGYVFSIWGIIYLGQIIYAGYLFKRFDKEDSQIFPWFVIVNLANIAWILLWHYNFVILSIIPMVLILASLIAIYIITDTERYSKIKRIPFQLYLAWISVATISNIAAALYVAEWNGFGIPQEIWSVVMIGVATKLCILTTSCKRDYVYSIVVLWAMAGILVKFFPLSDLVTGGALVSVMVIIMNIFANTYCQKK